MKRPSDDDILMAVLWLENNEGEPEESEPMKRVAAWLSDQVDSHQKKLHEDRIVRELVKKTGVSSKKVRTYWKRHQKKRD